MRAPCRDSCDGGRKGCCVEQPVLGTGACLVPARSSRSLPICQLMSEKLLRHKDHRLVGSDM